MLTKWMMWWWELLKVFSESSLMTSAVGSLAGAWGGAYAIQRITERAKRRDMLLDELRTCCHAIDMAHGVGSTYLNLKKQHVRELRESYDELRHTIWDFHEQKEAGTLLPGMKLHVGIDFQFINQVQTRASYVETLVLEKISAPVRVRSAAVSLARCTEQLNVSIQQRNDLIPQLAASEESERIGRVFGLPIAQGRDNTYADYVDSIYQYTNDSIYFARVVVDDLTTYGKRVREAYQKQLPRKLRQDVMTVPRVVWTDPEYEGLIPPAENYASWYSGFVYRIPRTRGRRFAKLWYCSRKSLRTWSRKLAALQNILMTAIRRRP
jgi:hypothetical protein